MIEHAEIDAMAAEYVLGTLEWNERREVMALRAINKDMDKAISYWERRLSPLSNLVAEIQPSSDLLKKINRQIDSEPRLMVALNRWRSLAIAASVLLLAVTTAFIYQMQVWRIDPQYYTLLQTEAKSPVFMLSFDEKSATVTVQTIGAKAPNGKSFELWIVADGAAPKSMGIVLPDGKKEIALSNMSVSIIENATFAVSVEPLGGSPTGAPTGPIPYSGKLVRGI